MISLSPPDTAEATVTAGSFYRDRGASAIMRAAHFPDDILSFLQMECLVVMDTIRRYRCDSLVELGCYDGRALEVARAADAAYLGVDVNAAAIARLRQRIADERLQNRAAGVLGDVTDPTTWSSSVTGVRPLQLLPFNLLGNLPDPRLALTGLRTVGGIAVLSVFNEHSYTTQVRRQYYSCSVDDTLLELPGGLGGVSFRTDDGFHSQSFSAAGLAALLEDCGATTLRTMSNRLGTCVVMCLN